MPLGKAQTLSTGSNKTTIIMEGQNETEKHKPHKKSKTSPNLLYFLKGHSFQK